MQKFLGAVLAMLLFSGTAQASVYVWKDNVNGFTFSFPDSWSVQTEDAPSTRLRIAGPIGADFATCRVKADADGRLKIYPKHLMTEAVNETLNRDFWEHEVGEHANAVVADYHAAVSMGGQGDATAIKYSFVEGSGDDRMQMFGTMIGSIYGGTRYVVGCSARSDAFMQYAPLFASIMESAELDSRYHPFATGYYRDFLADPKGYIPVRTKPGTIELKNSYALSNGR